MVYKIRVRPREDFDASTFESRELRKGLTAVYGRLKPDEPDPEEQAMPAMMPGMTPSASPAPAADPQPMRLQSLQFDSDAFTLEKAFDWMNEYGYRVERLEFARQWQQCELDEQFASATKTDGGKEFSKGAYLLNSGDPSTWKLRVEEEPGKVTVAQLGRAAAALGPGFRGNRAEMSDAERKACARKLMRLYHGQNVADADIPDYLFEMAGMKMPDGGAKMSGGEPAVVEPPADSEPEYVERDADLFAAGEYRDKNLTVTEADIQRLAATPTPVPILVEHVDTTSGGKHVWKLGEVASLAAAGHWLKGKLKLLPEANALLQRIGIKGLSVTVPRSLERVVEVSVTGSPRVAGAQMFRGEVVEFTFGSEAPEAVQEDGGTPPAPPQEESHMAGEITTPPATGGTPPAASPPPANFYTDMEARFAAQDAAIKARDAQLADANRRFEELRMSVMRKEYEREIDEAIRSRRLPPVAREQAIALRMSDAVVRFNETDTPAGELFAQVLAFMPARIGGPMKGDPQADDDPEKVLSPEQKEFYRQHYPDLALADIVKFGIRGEVK